MPIVKNDLLGRKALEIYQDTDGFNFSMDTMLLADFVSITARTKRICDLCSGNAPIPLYLTLKTSAKIVGVEIQKESYDLAIRSIEENHLENQITMVLDNLKDISSKIGKNCYEVVTCNPP
ncbi:MAG: methyltransferase, partial [Anaeroplasmataceae bacterium]|nr:methyltransferase [Anaeroplasmataceae bacterium]